MTKDAGKSKSKRVMIKQSDFPRESLQKALVIAQAIWDNFAGKSAAPHEIALALDLTPTSGSWRNLCGTSIAYGLTEGGYNASEIKLSDLGKRIIAPTHEGDDVAAKVEAILLPVIMGKFFSKYDKAKFPKKSIAANVLIGMGIPKERASRSVELLLENGKTVGILHETKTGLFVACGTPKPEQDEETEIPEIDEELEGQHEDDMEEIARRIAANTDDIVKDIEENNKVFISHGKNKEIVKQLKELLTFGKFNPIVSVEKDTASVPVPEKVFNDMRLCAAAVIHVGSEGEYLDKEGNSHRRINENVLIEIGAAIALYKNRFVLLVEKGVQLPSNLQGLYRCEYEGKKLDYEATMKLLKTFNGFR